MAITPRYTALERSLAYEQASGSIESYCQISEPAGALEEGWYDLATVDDDEDLSVVVGEAAMYLDAHRLLQHHPEHPRWVIVLDEDEPLAESEVA